MADGNFTVSSSTPEVFTRVRGEISDSRGDVSLIRATGEEVPAIKGTKIYLNDTLSSRDDSSVIAYFGDSGVLVLGQNQQAVLASDFFKNVDSLEQVASATQNISGQPDAGIDLAALEQAIQSGQNIEELLEPTAAGADSTNENGAASSVIFYQRTGDSLFSVSGFDPTVINVEQERPLIEIGDLDSNNQLNVANDAPDALDDTLTVSEDGSITLNLLANDTDLNGDALSILSVNGIALTLGSVQTITVTNGIVSIDAAGVITFTPTANYNGEVSFPYVISDPDGLTDTADVNITVTGINDQPVAAVVPTVNAEEDGSAVDGAFGVSDADTANTHSYLIDDSSLAGGSVVNNGNGTFTFDPGTTDFQSLAVGETQDVTFTYTAVDNSGTGNNTSAPVTVTVQVTGTNDQPTLTVVATGTLALDSATNTLTGSGALSFDDIDSNDVVTVSVNAAPSLSTSAGVVLPVGMEANLLAGFTVDQDSWDFSTSADLDFLTDGQTITLTYDVVATDDSGAANDTSDVQTVIVTLTGTTDVLVSEDFEGVDAAVGWSNTSITKTSGDATNFLGRFGGSSGQKAVTKDFFLGTERAFETVTIKFDMYEIDSWDNELFKLFVNSVELASDEYSWRDNPADGGTKLVNNIGNTTARWSKNDEVHTYEVQATVRSDGFVKLGFGSTVNQRLNDESYGIDNIEITAVGVTGEVSGAAIGPVVAMAFADASIAATTELNDIVIAESEVRTISRDAARVIADDAPEIDSDDIFFGVPQSDTFSFKTEDADGSTDTIADFTLSVVNTDGTIAAQGDVLNFVDLLEGEGSGNAADLTNYLSVSFDGVNSAITVDSDGAGGDTDLTVVLQGVDLGSLGVDQAAILQSLIDSNNLSVDQL